MAIRYAFLYAELFDHTEKLLIFDQVVEAPPLMRLYDTDTLDYEGVAEYVGDETRKMTNTCDYRR